MRLLLVEDELEIQSFIRQSLAGAGYEVHTCLLYTSWGNAIRPLRGDLIGMIGDDRPGVVGRRPPFGREVVIDVYKRQ